MCFDNPILLKQFNTLSFAEFLQFVHTYTDLEKENGKILVAPIQNMDILNVIALAERFHKARPVLKFKALFERWDRNKLVSEMSAYI